MNHSFFFFLLFYPLNRYYRSGMEMVRMATIYYNEGHLENAYILYFKFMTLFLEKIQLHPEYKTVPTITKKLNQDKLKEVLPIAEKLKSKLLEKYKSEYTQFLAAKEAERVQREANQRAKEKNRLKASTGVVSGGTMDMGVAKLNINSGIPEMPSAPPDTLLDQVIYPNDFPTSTNKSNLPTGLLLPDLNKTIPK